MILTSNIKENPIIKSYVIENDRPSKISHLNFGILSSNEMMRMSQIHVTSRDLFQMPSRKPSKNGVLDPRLGISDKSSLCFTCNKTLVDCVGHFGYIKLELPVFHIGYFKSIIEILQTICKKCARVMLCPEERKHFLKRLHDPKIDVLRRGAIKKKILEICKKKSICSYCNNINGFVKKINGSQTLKLVHEKYRSKNSQDLRQVFIAQFSQAIEDNKELQYAISKAQEDLSPLFVQELFTMIPDQDCELLWLDPMMGRPEKLILNSLLVPPVCIRPSVPMESGDGSNEDDLTVKLQEIIQINFALKTALSKGATMNTVMEDWDFLQVQVAQFITGDTPGLPRQIGVKPIRGLCQRLKGKQGRFRGNLSGKRVDFSARTVISPDPNLRIDQVGVPSHVAKVMTYPEIVTRYNINKMKKLIDNGPFIHPGANLVRHMSGSKLVKNLQYGDRKRLANDLKIGDIVERHMEDGDIVLFNRQPSLHKMSIMSHHAKVMPWRTFRFNECVCSPYNADFDGDEMNMHLPQTEEARSEANLLMGVKNNLITPRNGEPLVAATQDFLTAGYLLTQKNIFYNREEFCQILSWLGDGLEHIDIPPPSIFYPVELWTGKQVINILIRPNNQTNVYVNLELKERNYTSNLHMCKHDGYVCFINSELISGNLCKKTLGDGSKKGLFYVLIRDHGEEHAARCMNRLAKLCARWLGNFKGFSIGIDDVTPSFDLIEKKKNLLQDGYDKAELAIQRYNKGQLTLKAGCDAIQSLESELNGLLGKLRETAGQECMKALPFHNNPRIMAECGSKGSALNISQMVACVGQQSVGGKRAPEGFVNRTLPHFLPKALGPAAKGFVSNSFYSGLTATEFFFHTMGGREGLVDTAVKTAETGYMARRLMKALEDLSCQYDSTVRNSEGSVVQFTYGDDGLNPAYMETDDRPVDFHRLLQHIKATVPDIINNNSKPWTPYEIRKMGRNAILRKEFQNILPSGKKFLLEIEQFFDSVADNISNLRKNLQLPELDEKMPSFVNDTIENLNNNKNTNNNKLDIKIKKDMSFVDNHNTLKRKKPSESLSLPSVPLKKKSIIENELKLLNFLKNKTNSSWIEKAGIVNTKEYYENSDLLVYNVTHVSENQLEKLLELSLKKYYRASIEPGEAVGAIGAQSISEPGTQMTLKTFHFAGVASMNVTLGVPRIKEIINASKSISTPIITAALVCKDDERSARIVKGRIEKTTLGEIAIYIKEIYASDQAYLSVKIDLNTIEQLHLDITGETVRQSILSGIGAPSRSIIGLLQEEHVLINPLASNILRILPPSKYKSAKQGDQRGSYFALQALKNDLPSIIVQGISSVHRAVINYEENNKNTLNNKPIYHLLVEGYGLLDVMGIPGVDGLHTTSNHIMEVEKVLGIEAARELISNEVSYIMSAYGIGIDRRHLMLLSDIMTFKGMVLGITRYGISKMRESVLMLASFEKTTDHLFDAAVHGRTDTIVGVSECIIMGIPVSIGTGLFKLLQKVKKPKINNKLPLLNKIL